MNLYCSLTYTLFLFSLAGTVGAQQACNIPVPCSSSTNSNNSTIQVTNAGPGIALSVNRISGLTTRTDRAAALRTVNNQNNGVAGLFQSLNLNNVEPALEAITTSRTDEAFAIRGIVSSESSGENSAAIRGINNGTTSSGGGGGDPLVFPRRIGVWGSSQSNTGIGVRGTATGARGTGISGRSETGDGVRGSSEGGTGVTAVSGDGRLFEGVGRERQTGNSRIRFRVENNGDIVTAGQVFESSDKRQKTNIKPLKNVLEKLIKIQAITFERTDGDSRDKAKVRQQIGLLAQEVEPVFPALVATSNDDDTKFLAYSQITALLIEAVKELNSKNEALKKNLEALEKQQYR